METLENLLSKFADLIVYQLLNLEKAGLFTTALHYFISTFILISILVILVTYIMGVATNYMPMDKIRIYLERRKKSGLGNVLAATLGAITPFCSCSSIPLFVGMMQARIPLGVALSFLITSPLVNEIAIALFWVAYGWKVTVIYILTGILLGITGGLLLEKLKMEKYIAEWLKNLEVNNKSEVKDRRSLLARWPEIHKESVETLKKLVPYIFVGIAVGSFIHGYVPQSFFEEYISESNLFAVPIAVIMGIPLYIDAVGVLPVVETLVDKGVPLGTAIAFMMGSIGLSLPEALLLKKVMQKKLIIAFFSVIGLGMIISGYVFNSIF
ncbi:permease [Zunongwangia profunda]|uniref:permease n=1 Tax=Zunongwangia profunda TaxID=398743 RepID=UPI001D19352F|nr:permease [Zunongwangia profunda]MCC4227142.1 permease [Zunongwangia profunda]|tara:strand:+ start:3682 stop:4656 length:975 start_codon:yes stop_codon:yes gene_type:complete